MFTGWCCHSLRLLHRWLISSRPLGKPDSQQPYTACIAPFVPTLRGIALTKQHSCSHYRYSRGAYFTGADLTFKPHFSGLRRLMRPFVPHLELISTSHPTYCFNKDVFFQIPCICSSQVHSTHLVR